ncbi:MAG: hypothetical protein IKG00_03755 [Lachnospiraceae bacterium]|nr:hypothetical protein [Lachnospiraceae bacterium]
MGLKKGYLTAEIPVFIGRYIIKNHIPPTVEEVSGHFHISKDTAHRYLIMLDETGVVPYRHRIGIPYWMFKKKTEVE